MLPAVKALVSVRVCAPDEEAVPGMDSELSIRFTRSSSKVMQIGHEGRLKGLGAELGPIFTISINLTLLRQRDRKKMRMVTPKPAIES